MTIPQTPAEAYDAKLLAGWTLQCDKVPGDASPRLLGEVGRSWTLTSPNGKTTTAADPLLVRSSTVSCYQVEPFVWRAIPDAWQLQSILLAARTLGRLAVRKVGKSFAVKEIADVFVSAPDWDEDDDECRLADEFVGGVIDAWPEVADAKISKYAIDADRTDGPSEAGIRNVERIVRAGQQAWKPSEPPSDTATATIEESLVQLVDVFSHIGFAFAAEPGRSVPVAEAISANAQAIDNLAGAIEEAGRSIAAAVDGRPTA